MVFTTTTGDLAVSAADRRPWTAPCPSGPGRGTLLCGSTTDVMPLFRRFAKLLAAANRHFMYHRADHVLTSNVAI